MSQKWSDLLSAETLVKTTLKPWRSLGDVQLKVPEGTTSKQTFDLVAEHQDAFRAGNAFSRMSMAVDYPVWMQGHFSYSEGYLAWLDLHESSSRVTIHHIESGKRSYFIMPERESIHSLAISSTLLVAVSHTARCYIWAHGSDRSPCSVRLPSVASAPPHLSTDTVVLLVHCAEGPEKEERQSSMLVIRCIPDIQQLSSPGQSVDEPLRATTREFPIKLHSNTVSPFIMIDKTRTHVIVVYRLVKSNDTGLYLVHFDCHRNIEFEGHIAGQQECDLVDYTVNVNESSDSKSEGGFHIWSISRISPRLAMHGKASDVESMEYIHAVYCPGQRRLRVQTQRIFAHKYRNRFDTCYFLWKGIVYNGTNTGSSRKKSRMKVIDLDLERWGVYDVDSPSEAAQYSIELFGDDIFLVRFTEQKIDVWCFDRNLRMSGEDPEYSRRREIAPQMRLRQRTQDSLTNGGCGRM